MQEHQIDQFWNYQSRSCSDHLVSRQMDKNVAAIMNENDGENVNKSVRMHQLLEKYVDDFLTISSSLFYIDWFI